MNNKSIILNLDPTTETTGNAEQVAQLIGAAAWRISGDYLLVEDCIWSYRVTNNETYASVGMTEIPNGATVELWEGELQVSYDLGKEEQKIEQVIQDKGLNAPRLTPEIIDSKIKAVEYILPREVCKRDNGVEIFDAPLPLQTLTFCILTLENGFTVTGESACVSPENFDEDIGKEVAYNNAREKIWQLEGYLLKEQLYKQNCKSEIQSSIEKLLETRIPILDQIYELCLAIEKCGAPPELTDAVTKAGELRKPITELVGQAIELGLGKGILGVDSSAKQWEEAKDRYIAPCLEDNAPSPANYKTWEDVPTHKILPFIGSISLKHVAKTHNQLEHWCCTISNCGKNEKNDVISTDADLNASLANAIEFIKKTALINGWLD